MTPDLRLPPGAAVDAEHVWTQTFAAARAPTPRPALFLDRDGVIVEEVAYLSRPEDVRMVPGAAETIALANRLNVAVVVVTNQSGIGRGLYGWAEFAAVQARILAELAAVGAAVDAVFACPHHDDGFPPYDRADHEARKPNPGMLLRAARMLPLDLGRSWIVGDRVGDIAAGRNAGIAGGLHVATGYGTDDGQREGALALTSPAFKALAAPSIADVPRHIPLFVEGRCSN